VIRAKSSFAPENLKSKDRGDAIFRKGDVFVDLSAGNPRFSEVRTGIAQIRERREVRPSNLGRRNT